MFGFGQPKCPQCGMALDKQKQMHEWNGKEFCSEGCKKNFRVSKHTGGSGGSCH